MEPKSVTSPSASPSPTSRARLSRQVSPHRVGVVSPRPKNDLGSPAESPEGEPSSSQTSPSRLPTVRTEISAPDQGDLGIFTAAGYGSPARYKVESELQEETELQSRIITKINLLQSTRDELNKIEGLTRKLDVESSIAMVEWEVAKDLLARVQAATVQFQQKTNLQSSQIVVKAIEVLQNDFNTLSELFEKKRSENSESFKELRDKIDTTVTAVKKLSTSAEKNLLQEIQGDLKTILKTLASTVTRDDVPRYLEPLRDELRQLSEHQRQDDDDHHLGREFQPIQEKLHSLAEAQTEVGNTLTRELQDIAEDQRQVGEKFKQILTESRGQFEQLLNDAVHQGLENARVSRVTEEITSSIQPQLDQTSARLTTLATGVDQLRDDIDALRTSLQPGPVAVTNQEENRFCPKMFEISISGSPWHFTKNSFRNRLLSQVNVVVGANDNGRGFVDSVKQDWYLGFKWEIDFIAAISGYSPTPGRDNGSLKSCRVGFKFKNLNVEQEFGRVYEGNQSNSYVRFETSLYTKQIFADRLSFRTGVGLYVQDTWWKKLQTDPNYLFEKKAWEQLFSNSYLHAGTSSSFHKTLPFLPISGAVQLRNSVHVSYVFSKFNLLLFKLWIRLVHSQNSHLLLTKKNSNPLLKKSQNRLISQKN